MSEADRRHRWGREDNKELVMCLLRSSPDHRGFRKRLNDIYHEKHPESDVSEQLLTGQIRSVLKCKVFSDLEIEEFRRELELQVVDSCDSSPL